MHIIRFEELVISEDRQRKLFTPKALEDLTTSILSKGLMHPLVVRPDGEKYTLVAGERRSRAIRSISAIDCSIMCDGELVPPNHFPVVFLGELSPFALREAELEENLLRENLTWQEQAAAIAELDALRAEMAASEGRTHTARATASELAGHEAQGSEITKVTEAVVVAKHLADPEVAAAKTMKEAQKIIRKKAEAEHRAKLAEVFDMKGTPHTALLGSSLELAKTLPSGEFSVILTDPPYGIGADTFGDMADTEHDYKDDEATALACYSMVAGEGFRVTKDQAHAYVFLDPRYFTDVSLIFTMAGWDVWPTPLIWNKLNGMLPKPEHGPRRTYEMILFASKGKKKVIKVGSDVITCPMVTERDHGAQKPVPLYAELLSRSVVPGDKVVDFFSGSGTIFPAANKLKITATGIEINQTYYDLGISRLASKEEQVDLPDCLTV